MLIPCDYFSRVDPHNRVISRIEFNYINVRYVGQLISQYNGTFLLKFSSNKKSHKFLLYGYCEVHLYHLVLIIVYFKLITR